MNLTNNEKLKIKLFTKKLVESRLNEAYNSRELEQLTHSEGVIKVTIDDGTLETEVGVSENSIDVLIDFFKSLKLNRYGR